MTEIPNRILFVLCFMKFFLYFNLLKQSVLRFFLKKKLAKIFVGLKKTLIFAIEIKFVMITILKKQNKKQDS